MRAHRLVVTATIVAGLLAPPLPAQVERVVRSGSSCPTCRVEVVRLATAGVADDTVAFFDFVDLDSDGRGRIVAAPSQDRTRFFVYDARGALVGAVGRSGEGPGEFRGIYRVVVGAGDSLHAFDTELGRWSVFAPDLRYVRSQRIDVTPFRALLLPGDRLVVNSVVAAKGSAGHPLHLIGRDGEIVRSFGGPAADAPPEPLEASMRALTRAGGDAIWSAHVDRYRIERWTADGRLETALVRSADWFPRRRDYTATWLDAERPQPEIRGIWQDGDGLLFVLVRVPDADWRRSGEAGRAERNGGRREPLYRTEWGRYVDTIIEVIDPRRGVVVGSVRHPAALEGFTRGGLLYRVREDPVTGADVLDVYSARLRSR